MPTPLPTLALPTIVAVPPTKAPVSTPTDAPEPTDEPLPTDAPAPTDEPLPTDTPAPTDEPLPTDTPAPTDEPLPTDTPAPTGEPQPTDTPAPTGEPLPIETPSPTAEPQPTNLLDDAYIAYINAPNLNFREQPSSSAGVKVFSLLQVGQQVLFLKNVGDDNSWALIRVGNVDGYVFAKYVTNKGEPAPIPTEAP